MLLGTSDERGSVNSEDAIILARAMVRMSGVQRRKVTKERKERPERPVEDVIEDAATGSKVTQIVVTVTQDTHVALQRFAREEDTNQDEAAAALIDEALVGRGLLDE